MAADNFDDRVAVLEEHLVTSQPTAAEFLVRAERALAVGDDREARHCLSMAKISQNIDRIAAVGEEFEEDDAEGVES